MDQTAGQNQNPNFWQKNKFYLIAGGLAVLLIVYFATTGNNGENQNSENTSEQNQEETMGENTNQTEEDNTTNNQQNVQPQSTAAVTATGTLRVSSNPGRGNLMIESTAGRIYIQTVRDFSQFLGKTVSLQARGPIDNFVFLGLTSTQGDDQPAIGGPAEEEMDVKFSGTLRPSDNPEKGNYTISSPALKVYLKTVRDYSIWVGSEVELTAKGTIQSFTNASLTKK